MSNNNVGFIDKLTLNIIDEIKKEVKENTLPSNSMIVQSLMEMINRIESEYINPNNYYNYDEALKYLQMGYNRNRLNKLCKKYGIVNQRIRNVPIGFLKQDIERLKLLLEEEKIKKR